MKFNKKGFTGIEIALILCAISLMGYFAMPSIGKAINNVFSGDKNKQKQIRKISEQYSMFYKDDKGNYKPAPIPYRRTEEALNYINIEPPETLWTKFWKMGIMAVVTIVLLSYLGIWPIITLWWNKKIKPKIAATQVQLENLKTEKEELSADAKKIVQSVDEGLAIMDAAIIVAKGQPYESLLMSLKRDFLIAMSRRQDSTTKKLVATLKND